MKKVTIYDIKVTNQGFYESQDYMQFNEYLYPKNRVCNEDGSPAGVVTTQHAEPIMRVRFSDEGGQKEEFFVISPDLRKVLGWNTNMRDMQSALANEQILKLQERARANALYRTLDEFNKLPWFKRVITALKGGL